MNIILTGFEPFNGSSTNPSAEVIKNFPVDSFSEHNLIREILPVDSVKAVAWLRESIQAIRPEIIILLGEATNRPVVSIEKVAINWMDFRIADNSGGQVRDQSVVEDGPAAYFSTLPVNLIHNQLRAAHIPVEISLSAGAYLCNQVFYSSLYYADLIDNISLCGFIHLPSLPKQVVEKNQIAPSMSLGTCMTAITIALQACIQHFPG
ncbi:MAG: pyroglutamyl-peptidase I [Chloroflexi bacterium HGW-Chloroflexi-3]|nr:MAG: pyroglutamyl-peptidase I [Chloroflexi bacterium HGW-Chloroflexi-3]